MEYSASYYKATTHLFKRYRKRMAEVAKSKTARQRCQIATEDELEKRANFMLLFSIHGRPGNTPQTEVRYYFEWDIIVDNHNKTIVSLYPNYKRPCPPVSVFGDKKLRNMLYKLWFVKKSKWGKAIQEAM